MNSRPSLPKPGRDTLSLPNARTFMDKLMLFWLPVNVGESQSLVIHPASTTSDLERALAAG
jgi:O-acetylhomoserine/O-acetylserine sulfhydrylase-like pyridoxal-dependent enzyme